MLNKQILGKFVATIGFTALLLPSAAFAANISNEMVISPYSVPVNTGACAFQTTNYQSWEYIPFYSDFRTEICYQWVYLTNGTAIGNFGPWVNGYYTSLGTGNGPEYINGWVWWTVSPGTWFVGDTTWYLETNIFGDGQTSGGMLNAHGQTQSNLMISEGPTAYVTTYVY